MRADLPPGLQIAQAGHAVAQICIDHRSVTSRWNSESNNLVVLAVDDEPALLEHASRAGERGLVVSLFREPDLHGEATAMAVAPSEVAARLFSSLPLAGREVAVL